MSVGRTEHAFHCNRKKHENRFVIYFADSEWNELILNDQKVPRFSHCFWRHHFSKTTWTVKISDIVSDSFSGGHEAPKQKRMSESIHMMKLFVTDKWLERVGSCSFSTALLWKKSIILANLTQVKKWYSYTSRRAHKNEKVDFLIFFRSKGEQLRHWY